MAADRPLAKGAPWSLFSLNVRVAEEVVRVVKFSVMLLAASAARRRRSLLATGADAGTLALHGLLAQYRLPTKATRREIIATLLAPTK